MANAEEEQMSPAQKVRNAVLATEKLVEKAKLAKRASILEAEKVKAERENQLIDTTTKTDQLIIAGDNSSNISILEANQLIVKEADSIATIVKTDDSVADEVGRKEDTVHTAQLFDEDIRSNKALVNSDELEVKEGDHSRTTADALVVKETDDSPTCLKAEQLVAQEESRKCCILQ
jgi:hypothetical protein